MPKYVPAEIPPSKTIGAITKIKYSKPIGDKEIPIIIAGTPKIENAPNKLENSAALGKKFHVTSNGNCITHIGKKNIFKGIFSILVK